MPETSFAHHFYLSLSFLPTGDCNDKTTLRRAYGFATDYIFKDYAVLSSGLLLPIESAPEDLVLNSGVHLEYIADQISEGIITSDIKIPHFYKEILRQDMITFHKDFSLSIPEASVMPVGDEVRRYYKIKRLEKQQKSKIYVA